MVCVAMDCFDLLIIDKIEKCTGIFKLCKCSGGVTIGKSYPDTVKLGDVYQCTTCGGTGIYPTDEHIFSIKCFVSMDDFLKEEVAELTEERELVPIERRGQFLQVKN
jgi:hypothetical protein